MGLYGVNILMQPKHTALVIRKLSVTRDWSRNVSIILNVKVLHQNISFRLIFTHIYYHK